MSLVRSHARALLVGVILIVLTNAVVLAGVAYNRSGEPESVLRLNERELQIRNWRWPSNENSSIDVHLNWRLPELDASDDEPRGIWHRGLHSLQPAQLHELGFVVSGDIESDEIANRVARQPSRAVWLVLEHDGPAYQAALERARKRLERATSLAQVNAGDEEFQRRLGTARRAAEREELSASRLFIVDAARDKDALRSRYPDRQRYAIVRGRLRVTVQGQPGRKRLVALVAGVDTDTIRVPHAHRAIVEPFARSERYFDNREPRFAATVNFGRRFEPWIVDLALLK